MDESVCSKTCEDPTRLEPCSSLGLAGTARRSGQVRGLDHRLFATPPRVEQSDSVERDSSFEPFPPALGGPFRARRKRLPNMLMDRQPAAGYDQPRGT